MYIYSLDGGHLDCLHLLAIVKIATMSNSCVAVYNTILRVCKYQFKTLLSNPEEQKSSRRHNCPRLQAILQSHSHQDMVVLVPKQTDTPME